jgi:hypothetical protein
MESTLLIITILCSISYITNKILDLKNEIQHCKICNITYYESDFGFIYIIKNKTSILHNL